MRDVTRFETLGAVDFYLGFVQDIAFSSRAL